MNGLAWCFGKGGNKSKLASIDAFDTFFCSKNISIYQSDPYSSIRAILSDLRKAVESSDVAAQIDYYDGLLKIYVDTKENKIPFRKELDYLFSNMIRAFKGISSKNLATTVTQELGLRTSHSLLSS